MATRKDVRPRAPRGMKTVTQAFFEAIEGLPADQQESVATAALAGIRDELKSRRLKTREAAARAKAKLKARTATKAPAKTKQPAARGRKAAVAKRQTGAPGRKPAAAATTRATKKLPTKPVRRPQTRGRAAPPVPETESE